MADNLGIGTLRYETFIVDAPCGTGKTSAAINLMNSQPESRFLYITPFLDEVNRICESCPSFTKPEKKGSKMRDVQRLIKKGYNVVSTHALFAMFTSSCIELANFHNYTLILDEVAEVVQIFDITPDDMQTLREKYVDVNDDGILNWRKNCESYEGVFIEYKNLCDLGCLALYGDQIFIWLFPVSVFKAFRKVYVLTYMFEAQMQCYYYKYFNINWKKLYVEYEYPDCQFTTVPQEYNLKQYKDLITVIDEPKLNYIGDYEFSLSKSWYQRHNDDETFEVLKKCLYNFFKLRTQTKSHYNMWTTFIDFRTALEGDGYTKGFLSCTARAVNTYRHKNSLAYMVNIFLNPYIKNFFNQKNDEKQLTGKNRIEINEDYYALSELIQWLFRSCIRDKKPITIYIPSARMRALLLDWIASNTSDVQTK